MKTESETEKKENAVTDPGNEIPLASNDPN